MTNETTASQTTTCGACGANEGERCRTMSDDRCDAGKHVSSQASEPHWIDGEQSALCGKTAREGYAANPEYAGLYPAASQPKSIGNDAQGEIRKVHHLKTDPEVFDAVARGDKTHEIRMNDRDFQVGDRLVLAETESTGAAMRSAPKLYPLVYTGRTESRIVSHIQTGYGLADGWCILSFRAPAAQASAFLSLAEDDGFRLALCKYNVGELTEKDFIEFLDGHAKQAAQASATIQAAPDDIPSTMEDARKLIQYLRIENDSKVMELYDIKKKLAATIQEPVMVAEPVRDIRVLRRWATQIDRMASTFIDERSLLCQQAAILLYRIAYLPDAAPMVADPAGVALRTRYEKYMDWCQRSGYDALTWPEFVDSRINSGQRHHAPITYGIAATVKAVPSEALDSTQGEK